jgi:hypothetical protein
VTLTNDPPQLNLHPKATIFYNALFLLHFKHAGHINAVLSKTEQIQIITLLEKLTGSIQAKAKGV